MWDWFSHKLSSHWTGDSWEIVGATEEQEERVRDNKKIFHELLESGSGIDVVANRIAGGHSSRVHVLGRESLQIDGRIRKGRTEFDGDNRHGYSLGIKSQEDFARHIRDTLNDPETIGYRRADNILSLFNQRTNTVVIVHADNPDFGTCYRPRDGIKDFIKRNIEADRKSGQLNEPVGLTLQKGGVAALLSVSMEPDEADLHKGTTEERLLDLGVQVYKADNVILNNPLYKSDPAAQMIETAKDGTKAGKAFKEANKPPSAEARLLVEINREQSTLLKAHGLKDIRDESGKWIDVAAILRDPQKREVFLEDMERRYQTTGIPDEKLKLREMIDASHAFLGLEPQREALMPKKGSADKRAESRPSNRSSGPAIQ